MAARVLLRGVQAVSAALSLVDAMADTMRPAAMPNAAFLRHFRAQHLRASELVARAAYHRGCAHAVAALFNGGERVGGP